MPKIFIWPERANIQLSNDTKTVMIGQFLITILKIEPAYRTTFYRRWAFVCLWWHYASTMNKLISCVWKVMKLTEKLFPYMKAS